jgi:hypothetical protein
VRQQQNEHEKTGRLATYPLNSKFKIYHGHWREFVVGHTKTEDGFSLKK